MKYIALIIIGSAAILLLLGKNGGSCASRKCKAGKKEINAFEGMSMTIEEDCLCGSGVSVSILNETPYDIESGNEEDFELQVLRDGDWYSLERATEVPDENEHAYGYLQDIPMTMYLDWSEAYGELEQGRYRVVKRFYEYRGEGAKFYFFLAAEFDLYGGELEWY